MKLYLIRHAESENNAKPIYQRIEDPPITAVGRLQAERLAGWVETLKIDTLITSPVLRALQTTRRITDATGQHVNVWADVFEEGGVITNGTIPAGRERAYNVLHVHIIMF